VRDAGGQRKRLGIQKGKKKTQSEPRENLKEQNVSRKKIRGGPKGRPQKPPRRKIGRG